VIEQPCALELIERPEQRDRVAGLEPAVARPAGAAPSGPAALEVQQGAHVEALLELAQRADELAPRRDRQLQDAEEARGAVGVVEWWRQRQHLADRAAQRGGRQGGRRERRGAEHAVAPKRPFQVQVQLVVEDPQDHRQVGPASARGQPDLDVGEVVVDAGDQAAGAGEPRVAQHVAAARVAVDHRHPEAEGLLEELAAPVALDRHHLVAGLEQFADHARGDAAEAADDYVAAVGARERDLPPLEAAAFVHDEAPEVEDALEEQRQAEQRGEEEEQVAKQVALGDR
jgi:hypothetical protein